MVLENFELILIYFQQIRPSCKYTTIQEYKTTTYRTTTGESSEEEEFFTNAPSCIVGETKVDYDNCSVYFVCTPDMEDNKWVKMNCAEGTLYNPVTNVCDWPNIVYKVRPACKCFILFYLG